MKNILLIIAAVTIGLGAGFFIFSQSDSQQMTETDQGKQLYTCGMHPEIISEEPGYCPICGMKLVPKKDAGIAREGSIVIDPNTAQNMGLRIAAVTKQSLTKSIRAFGKIDYSEPLLNTVNVKAPGWIEKLYVNYKGEWIKAGQPLFSIYSPELVAAQQEYVVALKSLVSSAGDGNTNTSSGLLEAVTMRLKNWDISDDQIHNLVSSGEPTKSMIIKSPYNGIVIDKLVEQGDYLKSGMNAYKIADISKVWVKVFVYEQDVPFLKIGQEADITTPSLPEQRFIANIAYISPYLNDNRQIEIRLDVDNQHGLLRPGMYAEVSLQSQFPGERLAVPLEAVINSGVKKVAYVAMGDGSYMPRIIQTGVVGDNDLIEVLSGLEPTDNIVVSGQFLLDSETRLNESLAFAHSHSDHSASPAMEMETEHGTSDMADMGHDDHKTMSDKTHNEHDSMKTKADTVDGLSGIFTCPMPVHYHVLQYGPGQCPECGMNLVPVEQTDNEEAYYCPMTEDSVVTDKPGNCPKCGMKLVKLQRETGDD